MATVEFCPSCDYYLYQKAAGAEADARLGDLQARGGDSDACVNILKYTYIIICMTSTAI
jgi:hypothetical protein